MSANRITSCSLGATPTVHLLLLLQSSWLPDDISSLYFCYEGLHANLTHPTSQHLKDSFRRFQLSPGNPVACPSVSATLAIACSTCSSSTAATSCSLQLPSKLTLVFPESSSTRYIIRPFPFALLHFGRTRVQGEQLRWRAMAEVKLNCRAVSNQFQTLTTLFVETAHRQKRVVPKRYIRTCFITRNLCYVISEFCRFSCRWRCPQGRAEQYITFFLYAV
jgi:hypothetical protein